MLNLLILADRYAILLASFGLREPLDKPRKIDASQLLHRSWHGFGVVLFMTSDGSQNPNHPKQGSTIKVGPIRSPGDIQRIKDMLADEPRNFCLFVFAINTSFRAGELLSIRRRDVAHLREGSYFELKEPKTGKIRPVTINATAAEALRIGIAAIPVNDPDAPLFWSRKTKGALKVPSVTRLVKKWCVRLEIAGRFGSHSLRKTWSYQQRMRFNEPLSLLTKAYGHSSERQTLEYLCIQDSEIQRLYGNEI